MLESMASTAKFGWVLGPVYRSQGSSQTQARPCDLRDRPETSREAPSLPAVGGRHLMDTPSPQACCYRALPY